MELVWGAVRVTEHEYFVAVSLQVCGIAEREGSFKIFETWIIRTA